MLFDVHDRAANPVFRTLRDLELDRDDPIAVAAGRRLPSPALCALPEESVLRSEKLLPCGKWSKPPSAGARCTPLSFFILLTIAGLIGAVGILTNSQILIVGAMVFGPEYDAIIAAALGISNRDRGAVRDSLLALVSGFLTAIVFTFAFGVCVRAAGKAPEEFLKGIRPVSNLINNPNSFSVVVAILAGLVGVVSPTEARANALIGVFISVTTIPAAADIGVSLAFSSWNKAGGSALQLLLNVFLLIAVGAGGLSTQRAIWRRLGARQRTLPLSPPR